MTNPVVRCIGMISGTSADGIDIAWIETDGDTVARLGPAATYPYRRQTRAAVLAVVDAGGRPDGAAADALARDIEADHAAALDAFCTDNAIDRAAVDLVGFHGQTVFHDPGAGMTTQLGDPGRFAGLIGRPVVGRFREADMAAGGEGAPIVPLYHAALAAAWPKPVALLNIGGVSNVTVVDEGTIAAYDIGPGNAPLDDWVRRHTGADCDRDGALSSAGTADAARVATALAHPYFARRGPRSLDRNDFTAAPADGLSPADGAATLVAIAAGAIARARDGMDRPPVRWLVCGGGRRNPAIMAALRTALGVPVDAIEAEGLDGDAIEAQAIAFLAVRSRRGLPLTLPSTTGCRTPTTGGTAFDALGQAV